MDTPVLDFVREYAMSQKARLHMPGHKGKELLGFEKFDITEFNGADSLYHAEGIIKKSEENLTNLFGTQASFYSCEGSSLSVRAMLYLAMQYGSSDYIMAGRNAHSSLISASALLGFDIKWLCPESSSYLSCNITEELLEKELKSVDKLPFCVYITSPDYLGNISDISSLSRVCEKYGTVLVVDNAHGAYLKFLENDIHPISLGACMCCDSAHKTLPALTGGAYLHIGKNAPEFFVKNAKSALSLFGSTSPSYLILASLDGVNKYLSQGFDTKLSAFEKKVEKIKKSLRECGYSLVGTEITKITVDTKKYGYVGGDFNKILENEGLICEFFDKDYLVLMLSPENTDAELEKIQRVLLGIEKRDKIPKSEEKFTLPKRKMSIREATLSKKERVKIKEAVGRTLASVNVFCPPAVSLVVCGEEINEDCVRLCTEYGFEYCDAVIEP